MALTRLQLTKWYEMRNQLTKTSCSYWWSFSPL